MDTIHRADGISLFDGAAVLGTVFMLLGAIYGFILKWGPILWGLIGLLFGAALGLLLDIGISKIRSHKDKKRTKDKASEIILLIKCEENQYKMVEKVLWDNMALGVGIFKPKDSIYK